MIDQATGAVLTSADTGSIPALTGPALEWKRYELTFTASAPTVRLEMVNTAPGGSGNDLAIDDISTGALCEHGDAPDSYGTLLASNGPVHGRGTPHLGATADYEGDGMPSAAADGDDTAGTPDDEDGVTFNPALGYPNPTIRTGTDPVTLLPVQNTRPRQRLGGRLRQRLGGLEPGRRLRRRRRARRRRPAGHRGRQRPHLRRARRTRRTSAPTCGSATAPTLPRSTRRPAPRRTARSRTTRCSSSG